MIRSLYLGCCVLGLLPAVSWSASENLSPQQFEVIEQARQAEREPHFGLSVELRERATYLSNPEFDGDAEDDGWFWTQRLSVTGDFRANDWLGGRLTLLSAVQNGIADSPIEENVLDAQEAFLDIGTPERASLRVGRQELVLGSQRLIGSRAGTAVKRTWDGVRGTLNRVSWRLDALLLREVRVTMDGVFNDDSHDGAELAGIYATGGPAALPGRFDAYYLRTRFEDRATIEGVADQDRHSIGLRYFGEAEAWFWNWEAFYQFGDHGRADISAWSLAGNTGYRFREQPWQPEYLLSINVSSGDRQTGDGKLGTFDALFARGSYFSELALLAPSNFFNVHQYLRVQPRRSVGAFVDLNVYWRTETADGVYANPTRLLRPPADSDERLVNISLSAGLEWTPNDTVFLSLLYTHAAPQQFLEETGSAEDINFLEFTLRLRF
ncbi:MAG: alginate export family protein [Pseudomonadota bacterium]